MGLGVLLSDSSSDGNIALTAVQLVDTWIERQSMKHSMAQAVIRCRRTALCEHRAQREETKG